MSNITLQKKKRQKKNTKNSATSNSKLEYTVKTRKKDKGYAFEVYENKTKLVSVFDFRQKAKDFADFHNKNQVWRVNGGIPSFLLTK
tara:strand:+ start:65 stop:325 length:261 start_codon:yes stop_codon:yes gene_type:complete